MIAVFNFPIQLKDIQRLLEDDITIRANMGKMNLMVLSNNYLLEGDLSIDLKTLEKNCKMMIDASLKVNNEFL